MNTRDPLRQQSGPVWSVVVDYVMEFSDKAITDPAELAKLRDGASSGHKPFDEIDYLFEFTEQASASATGQNGPVADTTGKRKESAA